MLSDITKKIFTQLATFGNFVNDENVKSAGVVYDMTRLSYSSEFFKARLYLQKYMESIGLTTRIDDLGNLIGSMRGRNPNLKPVLTGSHLDTVPSGGAYDGALGIVTALGVIAYWHEIGYTPERGLDIVAFVEEEGIAFGHVCLGSKFLCGILNGQNANNFVDKQGQSLAEKLENTNGLLKSECNVQDLYERFVELHIEQGPVLDVGKQSVGIVNAIVGIERYIVTFYGTANHAGTTPMKLRQDALVVASECILKLYNKAFSENGYVCTVGSIDIHPNAENVVPGQARFTVEFRSVENKLLKEVLPKYLMELANEVSIQKGVSVEIEHITSINPIVMDKIGMDTLIKITERENINYLVIESGAGHDAMILANFIPTNMIFVPSVDGISHNPKEHTKWNDIEVGLNVLEAYLKEITSK
ncbi:M20 family metallo-hydrolase [Veillonella caviae]|uniref:M20 family metallo-hydrolase n=1 Tax=Veillonella caviae TaxID=248316 RepID=UPI0023FA00C0|nr:M20 family metallo-hydrolase [Veillonella caviae]